MYEEAVKQVILARLRLRRENEAKQGQLLKDDELFHETVRSKLLGLIDSPQFWNFSRCGAEDFYRTCEECGTVEKFKYRCSIKWCPRCQWRMAQKRKDLVKLWACRISQPKHLVLTQKNFPILTGKKIREHQKNLIALRRSVCFKNVKGGCTSIEITNEERGWHLHSHSLVDVRWLDMEAVAVTWGKIVGQEFAIVKIKDVRNQEYLRELCKYVVDGSELAGWKSEHILEFVTAVRGRRFFFSFGSMFALGKSIRAELESQRKPQSACECGCSDFKFEDEQDVVLNEIRRLTKKR
jgi:hypothetical protein